MSGRALRAGTLRAAPTSSSAATYFPSAACSSPAANNVLPSVWGRVARTPGECPPACRRNRRVASWACLCVCGLRQVGQHRTPELGQRHGNCAQGDGHRARLCVSFCGRDGSGHVEATHLASSRAPAGAPSRSWVYHSCRQPFRGGKNTRTRPRRGRKHASEEPTVATAPHAPPHQRTLCQRSRSVSIHRQMQPWVQGVRLLLFSRNWPCHPPLRPLPPVSSDSVAFTLSCMR